MAGSRTIKSLTALVMAMTVGTFVLMFLELEADPLKAPPDHLAAASASRDDTREVVLRTQIPLQPMKWSNVIVHASPHADGLLARGCHFVVRPRPDATGRYVIATDRWDRQADGRHAFVAGYDYNRNSVGICLIGDFSSQPPGRDQFDAAVALVRQLRRQCGMSADHVYLARQLPLGEESSGKAFPVGLFEYLVRAPLR